MIRSQQQFVESSKSARLAKMICNFRKEMRSFLNEWLLFARPVGLPWISDRFDGLVRIAVAAEVAGVAALLVHIAEAVRNIVAHHRVQVESPENTLVEPHQFPRNLP